MKEWNQKYNPFNSWKDLVHAAHFEAILKKKVLPPIIVNFDLTNKCNYNCRFCMFANRERTDPSGKSFRGDNSSLPIGYALTLPKLWKEWGVKAVCVGGGGDPTMHPDCKELLKEIKRCDLDLGFVSNGYLVNNEDWWKTVVNTSVFVGFSIDAGNAVDYGKMKGVPGNQFYQILSNIHGLKLAKKKFKSKCAIGYKFLIDEKNYTSIYEAIEVASKIGVNHIQIRPAINPNNIQLFKEHGEEIWIQVDHGRKKFERDDFLVMGVQHKFGRNFDKKHNFKKCRASMLSTTWCANGTVYMCTDTRGNPWAYLANHYPNPEKFIEYWGSKDHWDKVEKIDFKNKCDRCTLGPQNEFFEKVFINDDMERNLI